MNEDIGVELKWKNDMSDGKQQTFSCFLKLQIGPVQEFIAQARSTRDLWSGSYLLSWLMAAGFRKLAAELKSRGDPISLSQSVIFPALDDKPLCDFQDQGRNCGHELSICLTPSLPNLFVAALNVPERECALIGRAVTAAIQEEWKNIAEACWNKLAAQDLVSGEAKMRFDRQISRFLSVSWQVTPWAESYAATHSLNARNLDAVRHTRQFPAWAKGGWDVGVHQNKDALSGREESICGGSGWWQEKIAPLEKGNGGGFWPSVFRRRNAGDFLGAVTLVKRLWHRFYLGEEPWCVEPAKIMPVPSTWQVARHIIGSDEDEDGQEPNDTEPAYFAVLVMDGDEMGRWLSGEKDIRVEKDAHSDFSRCLTKFSLQGARATVGEHDGFLIYAGGDDVLAMLPVDKALECAKALRCKFRRAMHLDKIEASAGIAIAHATSPLQDVVRAARRAEKRAKKELGRSAVAVTLFKRSGESVEWGAKWDGGGIELYESLAAILGLGQVAAKFPHRVLELLTPYLTHRTGISLQNDAAAFDPAEVIRREFAHVITRQSKREQSAAVQTQLGPLLDTYLKQLATETPSRKAETTSTLNSNTQRLLRSVIGLCQTVAFSPAQNRAQAVSPDRSL